MVNGLPVRRQVWKQQRNEESVSVTRDKHQHNRNKAYVRVDKKRCVEQNGHVMTQNDTSDYRKEYPSWRRKVRKKKSRKAHSVD